MLRVDEEMKNNLSKYEHLELLNIIDGLFNDEIIDIVLFQDYDKGVLYESIISYIITAANKLMIPIIVDPKKRNFDYYKNVTLIKPNFKEFKDGINISISDIAKNDSKYRKELLESGSKMLHQKGIDIVFVTLAENGIYISYKKDNEYLNKIIHGTPRDISDVSGAGDTVVAVVAMLLNDIDIEKIAEISNIAGGIVCEELGVVPIDKQKLLSELGYEEE